MLLAEIEREEILYRLGKMLQRVEAFTDEPLVPLSYLLQDVVIAGLRQGLRDAATAVRPCRSCTVDIAIFGKGRDAVVLTLSTGNHHHRECQGVGP